MNFNSIRENKFPHNFPYVHENKSPQNQKFLRVYLIRETFFSQKFLQLKCMQQTFIKLTNLTQFDGRLSAYLIGFCVTTVPMQLTNFF